MKTTTLLLSWILNSVSDEVAASVIFSEIGEKMWIDLRDINWPRIFQLKTKIVSLSQGESSVSSNYTQMKAYEMSS